MNSYRSVGSKHKMDARVGDQVGLELGDVNVQGAVETERGGQGGDGLGQQAVQVGVGWADNGMHNRTNLTLEILKS